MPNKKQTFESAINELEEIVKRLEGGEESLEESLKLFEKGTLLAKYCSETLRNAEQKIVDLSQSMKEEGDNAE